MSDYFERILNCSVPVVLNNQRVLVFAPTPLLEADKWDTNDEFANLLNNLVPRDRIESSNQQMKDGIYAAIRNKYSFLRKMAIVVRFTKPAGFTGDYHVYFRDTGVVHSFADKQSAAAFAAQHQPGPVIVVPPAFHRGQPFFEGDSISKI